MLKIISPVDGAILAERPKASSNQIEKALDDAANAQMAWRKTPLEKRADFCRKALAYFLDNSKEIGEELTRQMGRPIRYSPLEITKGFKERAEYMISIAGESLRDIKIEEGGPSNRFLRKEPLGTVLVLAPWNYPYLTSVNAVIPALMAGNTIILKHAEHTLLCAERYANAFQAADIPKGVFQFLHLDHGQVAQIIEDERVNHVTFTGSVEGGLAVQRSLAKRFATSTLELGGKDPAYVRHDANLSKTLDELVDGAFFNSGQSCCGVKRIYVDEKLYEDFLHGFGLRTKEYRLGNPLDPSTTLGPVVCTQVATLTRHQIAVALKNGAKSLVDPNDFPNNQDQTPYLAPQALYHLAHDSVVMQDESFAPLVGIMPVRSDEEALRLMNDSRFGLTASIWTRDIEAARQLGSYLRTGTIFMNRCDYLDPALAWTGQKNSGRGISLSALGYAHLTRIKSYHFSQM